MEKVLRILLIVIITSFSLTMTSCDDDEDDNYIVGQWSCPNHYNAQDFYTFNFDGTYSWECPLSHDYHSGFYTYDSDSGVLATTSGKNSNQVYTVIEVNSDTMILTDKTGNSYTYTKENQ